jgi:uncharacterized protein YjbK
VRSETGPETGRGEEREFKLGIPDEEALRALVDRAGGRVDPPAEQENHFFDSAASGLRARKIGLRIRLEGDRFWLTLKGPVSATRDSALAVRAELEVALNEARARAALEGALPIVALLDLLEPAAIHPGQEALLEAARAVAHEAPLLPIGSFRNVRTRVHTVLQAGGEAVPAVLEFDRTEFGSDDVRREVEVEVDADAPLEAIRSALERLFASVGVEPTPTSSKLSHFLERLDRRAPA